MPCTNLSWIMFWKVSPWFKSIFHCNEEWFYNLPLLPLLMRIHRGNTGKLLPFKRGAQKIHINHIKMHVRKVLPSSSVPCWPLLNSVSYCTLSVSSAHYLSCLTLLLFSLTWTFKSSLLWINYLMLISHHKTDENEQTGQLCIPSEF